MHKYLVTSGLFHQVYVYAASPGDAKKQVSGGGCTKGMRATKASRLDL
jgi:hypothetical protein